MSHPTRALIRERFQVRRGDTLPYTGFLDSTRKDLASLFAELGFQSGAEIGVCSGEYSEVLLKANPQLRLLCVDPWGPYISPWRFKVTTERAEDRLRRARERLKPYPNVEFIRKTSLEAAHDVPDNSLDFVYIDGLHDFDNAMMDLITWGRKVRKGGIVSGHDYWHFHGGAVVPAVDAYVQAHRISEWYITREKSCSFFWVK